MPILWEHLVSHLLSDNYFLAKKILDSSFAKLKKSKEKLLKVDDAIDKQVENGIIEKITDIDEFRRENPNHSFLAHMPVFRMEHDSTKCRIVFLSNLCQKNCKKALVIIKQLFPGLI